MKYGLAMFPSDTTLAPGEFATAAEEHGFESVFFPEHSLIPASRVSHFDESSGDLPSYYWHTLDLFVALTAAAAATSRIMVGSGICLLPQRDPIWTAKAAASVDHLSGGRLIFGIGAGWNKEEMESHGYDFRTRVSRMGEHARAIKAIWHEDEASFDGPTISFERAWAWPKPVQRPHPPILIGGAGPTVSERVLDYGDGWLAEPEAGLEDRIDALIGAAPAAGREGQVSVTIYGAEVDDLDRWRRPGVERCVFWLEPDTPDVVLAGISRLAGLIDASQDAETDRTEESQ